jgi:hypothetical protein
VLARHAETLARRLASLAIGTLASRRSTQYLSPRSVLDGLGVVLVLKVSARRRYQGKNREVTRSYRASVSNPPHSEPSIAPWLDQ